MHTMYRKDDKATTKRIWLFTNDDNPNANDNNRREQSFQHAKDMAGITLFPIIIYDDNNGWK